MKHDQQQAYVHAGIRSQQTCKAENVGGLKEALITNQVK